MSMAGIPEPKLNLTTEEEKGRNAWWFRQIATTLAVGNAGGVVAISGFAGNIENIDLGMTVSYPAISFFFAGAFCAAIAFVVQFIYSFTRMEAIAEHGALLNRWRADNGQRVRLGIWSTCAFLAYVVFISATLGLSSFYFYRGAASVSYATAAIACSRVSENVQCSSSGAWLFVAPPTSVRERVKLALRAEAEPKGSAAGCRVAVDALGASAARIYVAGAQDCSVIVTEERRGRVAAASVAGEREVVFEK